MTEGTDEAPVSTPRDRGSFVRAFRWLFLVLSALVACFLAEGGTSDQLRGGARAETELCLRTLDEEGLELRGVLLEWHREEGGSYLREFSEVASEPGFCRKVPTGSGFVVARKAGFVRAAERLSLVGPKAQHALRLFRGRTLKVGVREDKAEPSPLVGATVLVTPAEGQFDLPFGGMTNERGEIEFSALPKGPLRVRIFARGFESYEAVTDGDLLVGLRPVRVLLVRVLDGERPVENATVYVSGQELWPPREMATGPKGEVSVSGLGRGSYALYAVAGERVSLPLFGVQVTEGSGVDVVTLRLGAGEFIELTVQDDEGHPVGDADAHFSVDGMGQFSRYEKTGAAGTARIGPLFAAVGFLQVAKAGFVERVVPIEAAGPLSVVLDRTGTLVGRVVDERDFPIPMAEVTVNGTDRSGMPIFVRRELEAVREAHFNWASDPARRLIPSGELGVMVGPVPPIPLASAVVAAGTGRGEAFLTDARGRFEIPGVAPGQVVAFAREQAHLDGKSEVVTLVPGGRAEVRVVLGSGAELRGRVLDDRDFPVAQAKVTVVARGFERQLYANEDGTFVLGAAPDSVTLRVALVSSPLRTLVEESSQGRRATDEIVIRLPPPRPDVRLRVVDAKGDPIPLAQVRLTSRDRRAPLKETRFTDAEGRVEFTSAGGLLAGIEVRAPGYVELTKDYTLVPEMKVTLAPSVTVEGRVTVARGRQPAAGADVTLRFAGTTRATVTDEVGEYRIKNVAPGAAILSARKAGVGEAKLDIRIGEAKSDRPELLPPLDLVPGKLLRFRVVDRRGFPVPRAWISTEPVSPYQSRQSAGSLLLSGEGGAAELVVPLGNSKIFAAFAGAASGEKTIPDDTRDEVDLGDLVLEDIDLAPASEQGTILVGLGERQGRLVTLAVPVDPAYRGILAGDELLEIGGEQPRDLADARELLSGTVGTTVELVFGRGRQRHSASVVRELFVRAPSKP